MNLTKEEATILRRQVSAVSNLFQKGLLAVIGTHVELTTPGRAWLKADDERIRLARAGGGGTRYIGERRRKQIATAAAKASHAPGAKRKRAKK